ncbi:MAG: long-chain fatty acid--CoA ligase [Burkholderiales bacterium]|nr:long-chain fatty acid--CoA ligase [Burkholderiales bacterium]
MKLLDSFDKFLENEAFIYDGEIYNYKWLINRVKFYILNLSFIEAGDIVQLCSDYHPEAIALFVTLAYKRAIIVPLTNIPENKLEDYSEITKPKYRFTIDKLNNVISKKLDFGNNEHETVQELKIKNSAGLIIMSSGTTGQSKAIVHDLGKIIDGQKATKHHKTILSFLLFDHIGGINTMLNALISGNLLVLPVDRDVNSVASLIQKFSIQILITSPSFLNLLVMNNVWDNFDLSCLEHINYGSEAMPQHLLESIIKLTHNKIKLSQAYGTSETGVIRTISKNNGSLLIKINNETTTYRVIDGQLEIKSNTTMLGYLNAPNPFTIDGWFKTGDMVEADGEWLHIVGRDSDIINIGGQKVFPIEIENTLLQMSGIKDAMVFKENNPILGNIIIANIVMKLELNKSDKLKLIRGHCLKFLENYKIPQKIYFVDEIPYSNRFKKIRKNITGVK